MSGQVQRNILRATPRWRGGSPRYDYALINGETNLDFVKIYGCFVVRSPTSSWQVALVHRYSYLGRHRHSGYIQLADKGAVEFIFTDTIIRMVHIVPPSTYNPLYTVQDIQTPDVFLRLQNLH